MVEALRTRLLSTAGHGQRDATLVSVLAYAGLRPGEALALSWGHIRERTILVERSASLGEIGETKTRAHRTVDLLRPLAQDLAEWRMACGRPDDRELVFPATNGKPWTRPMYRNWGRRIYRPAAKALNLGPGTPTRFATPSPACSSPRAAPWSMSQHSSATRRR